MDETGIFFCILRTENKILHHKGQEWSVCKKAKRRLTIFLCANMVGGKETPLVIWKPLKPLCFKCINKKTLPVEYHASRKAWMTSDTFETWLMKFGKLFVKIS